MSSCEGGREACKLRLHAWHCPLLHIFVCKKENGAAAAYASWAEEQQGGLACEKLHWLQSIAIRSLSVC